jgi:hypothetical protein
MLSVLLLLGSTLLIIAELCSDLTTLTAVSALKERGLSFVLGTERLFSGIHHRQQQPAVRREYFAAYPAAEYRIILAVENSHVYLTL